MVRLCSLLAVADSGWLLRVTDFQAFSTNQRLLTNHNSLFYKSPPGERTAFSQHCDKYIFKYKKSSSSAKILVINLALLHYRCEVAPGVGGCNLALTATMGAEGFAMINAIFSKMLLVVALCALGSTASFVEKTIFVSNKRCDTQKEG